MQKGVAEPFADCRANRYCRKASLFSQVQNSEMQNSVQYSMQINLQIFRQLLGQKPLLRKLGKVRKRVYKQDLHKKCRDADEDADTRAEQYAVIRAENMQKLTAYLMLRRIVIILHCNYVTNISIGILGQELSERVGILLIRQR